MSHPKSFFTRRAFFLGSVKVALASTLVGRLYWLQIHSGDHYKTLSDKNRLHGSWILPPRSQIFDEKGRLLAGNHFIYRALLSKDSVKTWRYSLEKALGFLHVKEEAYDDVLQLAEKQHRLEPFVIKEDLLWEEVAALELHIQDMPGVYVEQGQKRFYPYFEEFCHVVGYVGKVNQKELFSEEIPHFFKLPGVQIGKSGLEKHFQAQLCGTPGHKEAEVNAYRHVVREISYDPPKSYPDLTTSLHLELQKKCYERLKEFQSACAVIMDIRTGGIKAAVSYPGFDSNLFIQGTPQKTWKELMENPFHPLLSKFSQGQFAPGSTFKMIVALAGLEKGVISSETTFFCPGYHEINGHPFYCWENKSGHGTLNLRQAISRSCDVYFYRLALLLGIDDMVKMASLFGLGEKTALDFPGEKAGLIPTRSWKERILGKSWTPAETIITSIGQGYVLSTPLQLCQMVCRLVTGKKVTPQFLKDSKEFPLLGLNPKHLSLVLAGMSDVMNDPQGTSYRARSHLTHASFAGKTATSQVRRITKKDRELGLHKHWAWKYRDHALFVGYTSVENPRFAVSVVLEHGGSGGKVAAPVASDMMTYCETYLSE